MNRKQILFLLVLILPIIVSADGVAEKIENVKNNESESEPEGIYPRQGNPLKGYGQKLQSGAQNLIKGVQHFVVGVLGAINNVNIQNEAGDVFHGTDETTTSEYYDEETTTSTLPPTSTTTVKTTGKDSPKVPISTTRPNNNIRRPKPKVTTKVPPIPAIPQYQQQQPVIPQYPSNQGPYQQPIIPGYAPQYPPLYFPIQPSNNILTSKPQNLETLPPVSIEGQSQNQSVNVDTSQIQNEPLKSSNVVSLPQPHLSEIVTVTALPPQQQQQQELSTQTSQKVTDGGLKPVTLPALLEDPQTSPVVTKKPPNRLAQFSLNRKPSISQLAALKPSLSVTNNKVSVPLGTVLRPNEPKYPIKPSNFVRTLKPLIHPQVSVQRPYVPPPPPPILLQVIPEETVVTTTAEEEVEEKEKEVVTEEPETPVEPDNENIVEDTRNKLVKN